MVGRAVGIALGLAVLIVLAGLVAMSAVLMLRSPEDDIRHAFASPTGLKDIYLIETCQADACIHQALIEMAGADGTSVQVRCGLDVESAVPVFVDVAVQWSADESAVMVTHSGSDGIGQTFAIDFARDCNA